MKIKTKILTSKDIIKLLSYKDVLRITEEAYARISKGDIINPPKTSITLPHALKKHPDLNWINSMPAYLIEDKIVGIKWVNVTSKNPQRHLPVSMGVIIINDAITGKLLCMMDGSWLTYTRTGASVAIGVKYLASKKFKRIAIIGAGTNARTILIMLSQIYPSLDVNITSRTKKNVVALVKKYSSKNMRFTVCDSVEAAAANAEVILLSTSATVHLMKAAWKKKGDLVCSISGFQDLDPKFIDAADRVVFGSTKSAIKRIFELTGIAVDPAKAKIDLCKISLQGHGGRTSDQEIILYLPVGLAGADVLLALEAYKKSNRKKIGKTFSLLDTKDVNF